MGVFVDATFEEVESIVLNTGLTGVQLHFDAPPALSAQLRNRFGPALRILRVIHFDQDQATEVLSTVSGHDFSRAATPAKTALALGPEGSFSDPHSDAVLVDSRTATAVGGTGQSFDWTLASKTLFLGGEQRGHRIVAAGGLTPENVAEAIATLHPWGVDVVSGVEAAPGRKDPAKVRAFTANARSAV
jgi:phosphoribosylanthranilate isomerase